MIQFSKKIDKFILGLFLNFLSFSSTFSVFLNFLSFSPTFPVLLQLSGSSSIFSVLHKFLSFSSTFSVFPHQVCKHFGSKHFWPKACLTQTFSNRVYPATCVYSELFWACYPMLLSQLTKLFNCKYLQPAPHIWIRESPIATLKNFLILLRFSRDSWWRENQRMFHLSGSKDPSCDFLELASPLQRGVHLFTEAW